MTESNTSSLLDSITDPNDVRALTEDQLPQLAEELREFLLQSVSQTGGHLAAGLGTVDLTIALHYVFNTPEDKLVWDVGNAAHHQAVLHGRRALMPKSSE